MRLIDADALIEDLEYDVESDAKALNNTGLLFGRHRELVQFDKDCKQNAIDILKKTPTMNAVPIQYILTTIREWNRDGYAESAEALEILVMNWDKENAEWAERKEE